MEKESEYIIKKKSSIKFLKILNTISFGFILFVLINGLPYFLLGFLILNILLGMASIQIDKKEIEIYKLKNKL